MGADDALEALNLLHPRLAVPMHYNTFPPIQADPQAFATRAKQAGHIVRVMAAGEMMAL
jgi:L-ascorbate metabolism protein UlaG (beta-lactamase superfamily)